MSSSVGLLRRLPPRSRAIGGAAAEWTRRGCPYETARALACGDTQAQIEALRIFEELGALPALTLLRTQLADAGVRGVPCGPRATTRSHPFKLTNREVEVLGLLAEGLSNAEIAARLSLSHRTVEHHVSAMLSKLNAKTRSQGWLERVNMACSSPHRLI